MEYRFQKPFQFYKVAKESYIVEVAEEWKHFLESKVYQTLINYEVEITD